VWARPAHFGLRDRTLFQNGEKRFTLLQEDLQNSIAASQPRQIRQEPKHSEREREQGPLWIWFARGKARFVTGPTYRKPKWVIVSFHFQPPDTLSGPAKDNTWLPSYTWLV
jgi:hypothetical protein